MKSQFRNVGGPHVDWSPDGAKDDHVYHRGQIVESEVELDKVFVNKFVRVGDDVAAERERSARLEAELNEMKAQQKPVTVSAASPGVVIPAGVAARAVAPADGFDAMTLPQLREFAAEEEIDLKGAKTKEDAIRVLRTART